MIHNIFWDVDGTLFDTTPAITYAISKALSEMGVSIALNVIDGLTRRSFNHCLESLAQRFNLDPVLLLRQFEDTYRTISPANQLPFPGVEDVCSFIHNQGGLNIAVSHREDESSQQLLKTHGLDVFFDGIITNKQGLTYKSNSEIVLNALRKYSLNPTETLLVVDHELDIQTGYAAGIHTCLFDQEELSTSANFHISHFSQLLGMLQEEIL